MKKTPMNEIVINNENITQIEIISENMMDTEFEETEGKKYSCIKCHKLLSN